MARKLKKATAKKPLFRSPLFFLGVFLLIISLFLKTYQTTNLTFANSEKMSLHGLKSVVSLATWEDSVSSQDLSSGFSRFAIMIDKNDQSNQVSAAEIVKINITKINLDLEVEETLIKNGVWEISNSKASHLKNSAVPGQDSSIIIYGHNKTKIFGLIRDLKMGDNITLQTTDQKSHQYQVTEIMVVSPKDVQILNEKSETLILYTCTGFLDSQRFVVKAEPT